MVFFFSEKEEKRGFKKGRREGKGARKIQNDGPWLWSNLSRLLSGPFPVADRKR
jgi:hypothetical protein